MKNKLVLLTVLASLIILPACASAGSGGVITGVVWVLDGLNGAAPVAGTTITAEFTADGKVAGSAGCNRYSGGYTVSGSGIQFSDALASTMMACEQAVMDQESAYFQALAAAKSFTVKDDQLTLKDAGGKVVASFKAQSQELSGSSWLANSYNNGKEAVVSLIDGSEITLDFAADGQLSGVSGCNNYTGGYTVDGDKIKIGPLASTQMFCDQPEGVMDQEAQYLAALESAATYHIEGGRLELRTSDGALAASFDRK
jgi:heat shock protein HslJ